jgi:NTP pyrophosphatase (non-canonical NTP hydrolase)
MSKGKSSRVSGHKPPDVFQEQFLKTWRDKDEPFDEQLVHLTLGITGEAGEFSELVKKYLYKPNVFPTALEMMDELADLFYYISLMAWLFGFSVDDLRDILARKLAGGHGWTDQTTG